MKFPQLSLKGKKLLTRKIVNKILSHIVLIAATVFALFPIYFIFWTSLLRIRLAAIDLSSLIPNISQVTLQNYSTVLSDPTFFTIYLKNSLIFGFSAAAVGLVLALFTGYALSRFSFPGRKPFIYFIIALMQFPGTMLVIPYFFMFNELHLINTYLGLIIPYSAGSIVFSGILVKNYIDSIPEDLEEAALVDGETKTGAFVKVIIPLIKPILALGMLLAFVGPYTDFILARAFITGNSLQTLALRLFSVSATSSSGGAAPNYGVFSAFSFLMGIPILIVYLVFQKYIISGLTLGGVKG